MSLTARTCLSCSDPLAFHTATFAACPTPHHPGPLRRTPAKPQVDSPKHLPDRLRHPAPGLPRRSAWTSRQPELWGLRPRCYPEPPQGPMSHGPGVTGTYVPPTTRPADRRLVAESSPAAAQAVDSLESACKSPGHNDTRPGARPLARPVALERDRDRPSHGHQDTPLGDWDMSPAPRWRSAGTHVPRPRQPTPRRAADWPRPLIHRRERSACRDRGGSSGWRQARPRKGGCATARGWMRDRSRLSATPRG